MTPSGSVPERPVARAAAPAVLSPPEMPEEPRQWAVHEALSSSLMQLYGQLRTMGVVNSDVLAQLVEELARAVRLDEAVVAERVVDQLDGAHRQRVAAALAERLSCDDLRELARRTIEPSWADTGIPLGRGPAVRGGSAQRRGQWRCRWLS